MKTMESNAAKGYGFNFQWIYSWRPDAVPRPADAKALDFMARHGFGFIRIPTDYRFWIRDHRYFEPDESVFEVFDGYLRESRSREMHLSLNLHRAPGYCINGNNLEIHNLWADRIAQDAFVYQWENFARRYKGVPSKYLSFDLLNEPPDIGQYGFTRDVHQAVMRRTAAAIRAIDPNREIVIDGLAGGHLAMPELADLGAVHSGRGYQPMPVSHYEAAWWSEHAGLPPPVYPGTLWKGVTWNRQTLGEFYRPWRDVQSRGVAVHIGEFGCYDKTPNDVALRWFKDLFDVYREFGWGYSMWGFQGAFGIIDHGRPGGRFETIDGYRVDRDLLELMISSRV